MAPLVISRCSVLTLWTMCGMCTVNHSMGRCMTSRMRYMPRISSVTGMAEISQQDCPYKEEQSKEKTRYEYQGKRISCHSSAPLFSETSLLSNGDDQHPQ